MIEAMKQALDVIKSECGFGGTNTYDPWAVVESLEQTIAEAEKPRLDRGRDYEEGFVDGMQHQMQSSVDKAVNAMSRQWVGLTAQEIADMATDVYGSIHHDDITFATELQIKIKEKNNEKNNG